MLRYLTLLAIAALVSACAKAPYREMDAAEYMLIRAGSMQALEYAPAEYQAAHTALNDARRAMQASDYASARESIEFALQHARRAAVLAEEGRARKTAREEEKIAREKEDARQLILQSQAREAVQLTQAAPQPTKPTAAPAPKQKAPPATSYTVAEGDNLWTVAAQPQVYNDGLLWPLLYQANRDQIKDPRQIFSGQVLGIRRDMTEKEFDDARQRARESDIFPVSGGLPAKQ